MRELLTGDHFEGGVDLDEVGSGNKGVAMSFSSAVDQWWE